MTENEIVTVLAAVIKEKFGENIDVTAQTTPNDVDGWDSLAHAELLSAIEERFSIKLTFMEVRSFTSVGRLATALYKRGL